MSNINAVVNYDDVDPISLEKIKDLPSSQLFYVTNKKTRKVYAYDAINWFIHISNDRTHPITRQKLNNKELWDLYLTTVSQYNNIFDIELLKLLDKSLQKYHSNKIIFKKQHDKKNYVKIFAESPLFNIKIRKLIKLNKNSYVNNYIVYDLVYCLLDSRDQNPVFENLNAQIQLPSDMKIGFC